MKTILFVSSIVFLTSCSTVVDVVCWPVKKTVETGLDVTKFTVKKTVSTTLDVSSSAVKTVVNTAAKTATEQVVDNASNPLPYAKEAKLAKKGLKLVSD